MRFQRFPFHPSPINRTSRRVKNAERAIQRERDDVPLFPEMMRFKTADERLDYIDRVQIEYWQRMRDADALTWRKFRKRLYGLDREARQRFLDYWNSRKMIPGVACYASDTLTSFLGREDWIMEDIRAIQCGGKI